MSQPSQQQVMQVLLVLDLSSLISNNFIIITWINNIRLLIEENTNVDRVTGS
ncbi:hypothetical protein DAPPUDRAFT_253765 [Daphnia pulex]|uniref:Uncharacterized protein n=1 Tax=Daphnia pulex TaxID=6669 RepID=E9H5D0_DAPPU|nr:hypothetical protein DAPPUDRAFT_253765 [Daphnia pulex]|eukprot:EFX73021.1 hypothetical protein DAPPUDRAFT_253765 [Daphnia pulex]